MRQERSPQAIAAEFHSVFDAYHGQRNKGARHQQAFLAALNTYNLYHPEVSKSAAAHAVTQMMHDMDALSAM